MTTDHEKNEETIIDLEEKEEKVATHEKEAQDDEETGKKTASEIDQTREKSGSDDPKHLPPRQRSTKSSAEEKDADSHDNFQDDVELATEKSYFPNTRPPKEPSGRSHNNDDDDVDKSRYRSTRLPKAPSAKSHATEISKDDYKYYGDEDSEYVENPKTSELRAKFYNAIGESTKAGGKTTKSAKGMTIPHDNDNNEIMDEKLKYRNTEADECAPCCDNEEDDVPPQLGPERTQTSDASLHRAPGAVNVRGRAPGSVPRWAVSSSVTRAAHAEVSRNNSMHSLGSNKTFEVIATVVKEDDTEKLPTVYPIEVKNDDYKYERRRRGAWGFCILVCILVGLVVALVITLRGNKPEPPVVKSDPSVSMLDTILKRGKLICGAPPETDFSHMASVDFCQGIASAIFGVENVQERYELVINDHLSFNLIATGQIDISTKGWVHTLEHEVYVATEKTGFSFSAPTFYTGLMFGGEPKYAKCAASLNFEGECTDLKVCVDGGSSTVDQLRFMIPEENLRVVIATQTELYHHLMTPTCNVIAGVPPILSHAVAKMAGYTDEFEIGNGVFSKEPFALVTRGGDARWADFVNWCLQALLAADKHGITQDRANEMPTTQVFGDQFQNMFKNIVAAMGNFDELYQRHFGIVASRAGWNLLNDGTTGRIFSHPFGKTLEDTAPGHVEGGMLDTIMQRGYLNCGIVQRDAPKGGDNEPNNPSGMDVDYCHALAAAIFENDLVTVLSDTRQRIRFVSVNSEEAFTVLSSEDVDVVGLVPLNLENDVLEPTTGKGYTFTEPVFYPFNGLDDPLALATREDDAQWSSFVYWTVTATFFAEENQITKSSGYEMIKNMPMVSLFGSQHKFMMRNIVSRVGNYGEIFNNNVDRLGPRNGLNKLNALGGPQFYPYPGIIE